MKNLIKKTVFLLALAAVALIAIPTDSAKAQSDGYFPRVKGCVVWAVGGIGNANAGQQEAKILFAIGGGSKTKCESGNQDDCEEEGCSSNN